MDEIRILHVDDESGFADLTAEFLEREDDRLTVETAAGAGEGLDRLDDDVDCVVSDYDMPGRNGIEFLERVREAYPDLPFILFTGKGSEAVASDAISAGVTDYLQKGTETSQYAVLANRIANAVEQYRARRELQASRRRLSLFFEQSPLGVIEWDEAFEIARVNDAAEGILGYAADELVGDSWERLVPESEREAVAGVLSELRGDAGGYRSVNENVTRDGERIVCEWHNRVITDDDGEMLAAFSQFRDVTEEHRRRQRQERQREALVELATDEAVTSGDFEGALRRITETAADVLDVPRVNVWLFEADGVLTCVDHFGGADDGPEGVELVADRYPAYFGALERGRSIAAADVTEDPRTAELSEYFERNDVGALLDATIRSEGEVIGVVCHEHVGGPREWTDDEVQFAADVAEVVHRALRNREQVRRRRELEYQRSLLAAQQEAMPDGVLVVDEAGEIVSYNERFVEMWGLPEGVLERHDEAAALERVTDRLADPEAFHEKVEYLYDHPEETSRDEIELADGSVLDRYSAPVTGEDGSHYGRFWMFRDVTDRRERERKTERLHSTAQQLLGAETDERVAEIVVEALYEVLEMPINTVWVHDEGRAELRPVAWTERATGLLDEIPSLPAGEALAWEVFETGEPDRYDDVSEVPGRYRSDTPIRSELLLPLGEHGVVAVGSTDTGAFDEVDVSLARTLTAHAATALDRIERESDLRTERVFIDQTLDTLEDTFYVVGTDGSLLRWNDRLTEVTGYTDADVADLQLTEFFAPDDRERIEAAIEEAITEGRTTVHADLLTAAGDRIPYEFVGSRLTDPVGDLVGVAGTGRDVTERERRKRRLETVETAFENARECQFVVDAESEGFPLLRANEYYKSTVGLPTDEPVAGRTPTELFGREGGERIRRKYAECVESREPVTYTVELPVPGEGTVFRTILTPVVSDGDVTRIVGTSRDVTEYHEQSRKLERKNDRLEAFASVVSHDLRNPLQVAQGNLELARTDPDGEYLEELGRALDRMHRLTEDLLALAREGESATEPQPTDLGRLGERCWENVATGRSTLVVEADRTVRADPSRLQQLLENLFRNAVEHGSTSPRSRTHEDAVEPCSTGPGSPTREDAPGDAAAEEAALTTVTVGTFADGFYVADDGLGIPEAERAEIFESGYSTSPEGTGLGLSIVREIAEAHGWSVDVTESEAGGARFEITGVEFLD